MVETSNSTQNDNPATEPVVPKTEPLPEGSISSAVSTPEAEGEILMQDVTQTQKRKGGRKPVRKNSSIRGWLSSICFFTPDPDRPFWLFIPRGGRCLFFPYLISIIFIYLSSTSITSFGVRPASSLAVLLVPIAGSPPVICPCVPVRGPALRLLLSFIIAIVHPYRPVTSLHSLLSPFTYLLHLHLIPHPLFQAFIDLVIYLDP